MKVNHNYHDENVPNIFYRQLHLLEEINRRSYPTPNSNYLDLTRNIPDILGTFANELKALREIALVAHDLCINLNSDDHKVALVSTMRQQVNHILKFAIKQPWYPMASCVGKAPVAAEEGDLPTL